MSTGGATAAPVVGKRTDLEAAGLPPTAQAQSSTTTSVTRSKTITKTTTKATTSLDDIEKNKVGKEKRGAHKKKGGKRMHLYKIIGGAVLLVVALGLGLGLGLGLNQTNQTVEQHQVVVSVIVAGTVDDFKEGSAAANTIKTKLAATALVQPSAVTLAVTSASVKIDATIVTADAAAATAAKAAVTTAMSDKTKASTLLGVTIESIPVIETKTAVVSASEASTATTDTTTDTTTDATTDKTDTSTDATDGGDDAPPTGSSPKPSSPPPKPSSPPPPSPASPPQPSPSPPPPSPSPPPPSPSPPPPSPSPPPPTVPAVILNGDFETPVLTGSRLYVAQTSSKTPNAEAFGAWTNVPGYTKESVIFDVTQTWGTYFGAGRSAGQMAHFPYSCTGSASKAGLQQVVPNLVSGASYTLTWSSSGGSFTGGDDAIEVSVRSEDGGTVWKTHASSEPKAWTTHTLTFTAAADKGLVRFWADGASCVAVDDVSIAAD